MQQHFDLQKKTQSGETVQAKSSSLNATYLRDNRPQHHLFQLQPIAKSETVMQFARIKKKKKTAPKRRTLSGHGNLRRNSKKIAKFKVPKGKSIFRPAPPGATLGNLSMLLNEQNLSRVDLLKKMKVSTTPEIWRNKGVVKIIKTNNKIPKTKTQEDAIDELLKKGYDSLTGPQKGSLTRLESKKEFEEWSHSHVESETFKTFGEGEDMEDMELMPFENKLKSTSPHSDNEYVSKKTVLSQYVNSNPGIDEFTVNACSYDPDCPYTGFQLDQK
jgi:hypothetical protein